jgi:hypothetical protein
MRCRLSDIPWFARGLAESLLDSDAHSSFVRWLTLSGGFAPRCNVARFGCGCG